MSLTEEQTARLKRALNDRFDTVRADIARELLATDEAPYIALAGRVHDTAEAAVADLLEDVELASIDRHVAEIRAIDAALLRIAEGRYGTCVDCGEPIGIDRLTAQPTASGAAPRHPLALARSAFLPAPLRADQQADGQRHAKIVDLLGLGHGGRPPDRAAGCARPLTAAPAWPARERRKSRPRPLPR